MNEVEIIDAINKLQEKKALLSSPEQIAEVDAEIMALTEQLQPVEKSRDQKAFLDECAG